MAVVSDRHATDHQELDALLDELSEEPADVELSHRAGGVPPRLPEP